MRIKLWNFIVVLLCLIMGCGAVLPVFASDVPVKYTPQTYTNQNAIGADLVHQSSEVNSLSAHKDVASGKGGGLPAGQQDVLINEQGYCAWVKNSHPKNEYFVPKGSASELKDFLTNPPGNVVVAGCCAPKVVTLTAGDGQTHHYYFDVGQQDKNGPRGLANLTANFNRSRQDCTTNADGSQSCNTTKWTETVVDSFKCASATGSVWVDGGQMHSADPQPNPPPPKTFGAWSATYGACDHTCGDGFQPATITCNFDVCTGPQPTDLPCKIKNCPTTGAYTIASDWGTCSGVCGAAGTQTRTITCGFDTCQDPKPASSQICNGLITNNPPACEGVDLVTRTCAGTEVARTSNVAACGYCTPGGNTSSCSGTTKLIKDCNGNLVGSTPNSVDCGYVTTGPWTVGAWGNCSKDCGGGTQTRNVTCQFGSCPDAQPASSQPCNQQKCQTHGAWSASGFGACSGWGTSGNGCGGTGTATQTVTCNFDVCDGAPPPTSMSCNLPSCFTCYQFACADGCDQGNAFCCVPYWGNNSYQSPSNDTHCFTIPNQGEFCDVICN